MIRKVVTGTHTRVLCPQGHIDAIKPWLHYCSECGLRLDRSEEPHSVLMCDVCGSSCATGDMNYCDSCGAIATRLPHKLPWEKAMEENDDSKR